jgi:hypothetical protein
MSVLVLTLDACQNPADFGGRKLGHSWVQPTESATKSPMETAAKNAAKGAANSWAD